MPQNSMIIKKCEVKNFDGGKEVVYSIDLDGESDELWFKIFGDTKEVQPNFNPALVALLVPAMSLGKDIEIYGAVSKVLLENISKNIIDMLNTYEPLWEKISVKPSLVEDGCESSKKGCGTGFSAGIDSFATLAQYPKGCSNGMSVDHIFNFDVGAMGRYSPDARRVSQAYISFEEYKERAACYAKNNGFSVFSVSSNIDKFYSNEGVGFQKTHTIRNASAALLFENVLNYYFYSSTFNIKDVGVRHSYDMAYMDPILLPLLSTEKLAFFSSCLTKTRYEKTKIVSSLSQSFTLLDVCVDKKNNHSGIINCTRCWKCARTIMDLEALGRLDSYSGVFDTAYYYARKSTVQKKVMIQAFQGSLIDKETLKRSKQLGLVENYYKISLLTGLHVFKVAIKKWIKKLLVLRFLN